MTTQHAYEALFAPLRALDLRLADGFACIARDGDVRAMLLRPPGAPRFDWGEGALDFPLGLGAQGPLARVGEVFALSAFEIDLLLIAVAPEIDARYARLFGLLRGEEQAGRADVDLALDLLCADAADKLAQRGCLAATARLRRYGLLRLDGDASATILEHQLIADEALTGFLLGQSGAPAAVSPDPTVIAALPLGDTERSRLTAVVAAPGTVRCALAGTCPDTQALVCDAIATALGKPVRRLAPMSAEGDEADLVLRRFLLGAALAGAIAVVTAPGDGDSTAWWQRLAGEALIEVCDVIVIGDPDGPAGRAASFTVIAVPAPDYRTRLDSWRSAARAAGLTVSEAECETLAARFHVSPSGVKSACLAVAAGADHGTPAFPALAHAVRSHRGNGLARWAQRVGGSQAWDDLVLPEPQLRQLHQLCDQMHFRNRVEQEWGFAAKEASGRSVCALFTGPSGVGKTMAAGIVARSLHLDLYRVDLAQTVSKYIGETEKNLARIFEQARATDAVLFFDEADTLFGKRTEVKDAHDRYANLEVGYLLQKIEEYDGMAILATNLRGHIDDAFIRRLSAIVEFPFPDATQRAQIWRAVIPAAAPLAEDVDFAALAGAVRLAGGNIRNIALAAAYLAARDHGVIHQAHLLAAAQAEYQKIGRTM